MRSCFRRTFGLIAAYAIALQTLLTAWQPVVLADGLVGAAAVLCTADNGLAPTGSNSHHVCAVACTTGLGATDLPSGPTVLRVAPQRALAWRMSGADIHGAHERTEAQPRAPPA